MTGPALLLLGFGLGLRHATDADHLVVLSSLLRREQDLGAAARVAALWGLGHSVSFLGIGLLVVVAERRLPPGFELLADLLVAGMLITLGASHLVRRLTCTVSAASQPSTRPLIVGVIHGLAGSAAVALLAATSIPSRVSAAGYLLLFGLGTVVGMAAMTVLLAWSFARALHGRGALAERVMISSALLSVGCGIFIGVTVLAGRA